MHDDEPVRPSKKDMEQRRDFIHDCCVTFKKQQNEEFHRSVYFDPHVPDDLVHCYYSLVPDIRGELSNIEPLPPGERLHRIDRHKIAAGTAYVILCSQPMRDDRQLQRSPTHEPDDEDTRLNALFAVYTGVVFLEKWNEGVGNSFVLSERALRFLSEHHKWMLRHIHYPLIFAAQTFYLLEQLCLVEHAYGGYSCKKRGCKLRVKEKVLP